MITKQRLEELIQQKATIYSTHWKEEVNLSLPCEIKYDGIGREFLFVHEDADHHPSYLLNNLTENVEDAKWEEEFGCIEITKRLSLPTWEEVEEIIKNADAGTDCIVCFEDYSIEYTKYNCEYLGVYKDCVEILATEPTREGYIKCCRKLKLLLLGENK